MTDKYMVRCVPITTIKVCGKVYEADVEVSLVLSQKGFNELLGYIKVISKEPFVDGLTQPEIAESEENNDIVLKKAKTQQLENIPYEDIIGATKNKKTYTEIGTAKKKVAPKKD